ncbi:hypothetical protein PENTCL1PPCAC_14813, partial [Pristionchus entomophagus]
MKTALLTATLIFIPLEGLAGMLLNALLLYYLARTNSPPAARLYFSSCRFSAICFFCTSLLVTITVDALVMADGDDHGSAVRAP